MPKLCINCTHWEEVNPDKGVGMCCPDGPQFLGLTEWDATCPRWQGEAPPQTEK